LGEEVRIHQVLDTNWVQHGVAGIDAQKRGLAYRNDHCHVLDGGAHIHGDYATADDRYFSVGTNQPQFSDRLPRLLDLDPTWLPPQRDDGRRRAPLGRLAPHRVRGSGKAGTSLG
jgi:hypothetical protein